MSKPKICGWVVLKRKGDEWPWEIVEDKIHPTLYCAQAARYEWKKSGLWQTLIERVVYA